MPRRNRLEYMTDPNQVLAGKRRIRGRTTFARIGPGLVPQRDLGAH